VAEAFRCPRCGTRKFWRLSDGRRRCAQCRFDWKPGRLPLRLQPQQWRAILRWFVRGASSAEIARETGLERKRVLRALLVVRRALLRATLGTRRPIVLSRTTKTATIGLRSVDGQVLAELITETESEQLGKWLRRQQGLRLIALPRLQRYAGIVYRGRLYRVADSGAGRAPFGQVEAFWAYLQHQLRATGGIRRERLAVYLAAYAWRFNRRKMPQHEQIEELLSLIRLT
jgi:transposase